MSAKNIVKLQAENKGKIYKIFYRKLSFSRGREWSLSKFDLDTRVYRRVHANQGIYWSAKKLDNLKLINYLEKMLKDRRVIREFNVNEKE
jgi:hypothetical protein